MTIQDFINLPAASDPHSGDEDAFALAVDQAEGALRAGVRLQLDEYARMTPELRAAWIVAGNRIRREAMGLVAGPLDPEDEIRREVEGWADRLEQSILKGGVA